MRSSTGSRLAHLRGEAKVTSCCQPIRDKDETSPWLRGAIRVPATDSRCFDAQRPFRPGFGPRCA
jgi:hypothetical protein